MSRKALDKIFKLAEGVDHDTTKDAFNRVNEFFKKKRIYDLEHLN